MGQVQAWPQDHITLFSPGLWAGCGIPAEYGVEVTMGIEAHGVSPAGCGGETKHGAVWLTKDR